MRPLWLASEIKEITGFDNVHENAFGLSIDSRNINKGDIFIALKGPYKDGHDYIDGAFDNGAAWAVVSKDFYNTKKSEGKPWTKNLIPVNDTFVALEGFALAARKRNNGTVLGITGSFGKTTAKECAAHVLRNEGRKTSYTKSSFNNHWGVPLSVASLKEDDEMAVFEVGMNHSHEIEKLTEYVQPSVALITTIAAAHMGNFSSLEEIALAKAEIFLSMAPGSIAVLPYDNAYFSILEEQAKKRTLHIFTFGYKDGADLRILKSELKNDHTVVFFSFAGKQYSYRLNGYGDHLVQTISGVVAAMHSMGVSLNDTCKHIGEFHLLSGRGRVEDISLMSQHGDNINITIMDDSYNAAPESMAYGIKAFTSNPYIKGRRWLVLGDMLELGSDSIEAHKRMNFAVENSSPYGVLLFGQFMSYLYQELLNKNNQLNKLMHYNDIDILCKDLYALLQDGDAVFIKGSRGQWASKGRMAKVIDYLKSMNQDDQDERLMA